MIEEHQSDPGLTPRVTQPGQVSRALIILKRTVSSHE